MKRIWIKKTLSALLIFCMLLGILPPLSFRATAAASPSSSGNATATLAYTLKNLPLGVAVQNFYIGAQYIYVTQRSTGTTYLSRLKKDDSAKTATYCDHMVLNTCSLRS